jgi:dsDNA-binding SOS-regulon protein
MKKKLLSIIVALCFNAFGIAAQSPLRAPTSAQALKMAQINQWNNMLPYAAAALGTATLAGAAWHFKKRYEAERRPINTVFSGRLQEIQGKTATLATYKADKEIIDNILDHADSIKTSLREKDGAQAHARLAILEVCVDRIPNKGDTDALGYIFSQALQPLRNSIRKKQDDQMEAINQFIDKGVDLLGKNIKESDPLSKELNELKKTQEEEQARLRSLKQKAVIAKWVGVGSGLACGATGFAALYYNWLKKK